MEKLKILFLAANPRDTSELRLKQEAEAIEDEFEAARTPFELKICWAAEPLDLPKALSEFKPAIVHFSGHGAGADVPGDRDTRDVVAVAHDGEAGQGLVFNGPDGQPQVVPTRALAQAFRSGGASVQLVVLNACYSDTLADALVPHVDCVVGMTGPIHDDAATNFATGFYHELARCKSVAAAYEHGRTSIVMTRSQDVDRPRLKVRDGVDARRTVLAAAIDPSPAVSVRPGPSIAAIRGLVAGSLLVVALAVIGAAWFIRRTDDGAAHIVNGSGVPPPAQPVDKSVPPPSSTPVVPASANSPVPPRDATLPDATLPDTTPPDTTPPDAPRDGPPILHSCSICSWTSAQGPIPALGQGFCRQITDTTEGAYSQYKAVQDNLRQMGCSRCKATYLCD